MWVASSDAMLSSSDEFYLSDLTYVNFLLLISLHCHFVCPSILYQGPSWASICLSFVLPCRLDLICGAKGGKTVSAVPTSHVSMLCWTHGPHQTHRRCSFALWMVWPGRPCLCASLDGCVSACPEPAGGRDPTSLLWFTHTQHVVLQPCSVMFVWRTVASWTTLCPFIMFF